MIHNARLIRLAEPEQQTVARIAYYKQQLIILSFFLNSDFRFRVSYRILSWVGGKQDGNIVIVVCESMLTHA